ncbi:unnamed protein product [Prunus armeniaca]
MSGRYDGMRVGENVARPSGEVARVFGLAGVLTDPIQGRVRPVEPGLIGKSYVWLDPLVEILGNVQFTWETLPKFRQKVSCPKSSLVKEDIVLRSKPGVGVMPGSPQGSSRVPGNSGRVLSAWYQSLGSISCGLCTLCASLSCGSMMGSVTGRPHFDAEDSLTWMDLGY